MIRIRHLVILVMAGFLFSGCSGKEHNSIKVMSFNIRYANPRDGINRWDKRKEMAVEAITSREVDIVGMQEVLLSQQQYLSDHLSDYQCYAAGRDDGKSKGEMGSIFYLRDRFELIEKSTFWLSETPDSVGSKGWNAVLPRIVSWVKLHDKKNDSDFYFFNTHFSHVGEEARKNSAKLLIQKISEIAQDDPVILSGDFNCTFDSEPYAILVSDGDSGPKLFDTQYLSETEHYGGNNSINGFGKSRRDAIIDYLFCNSYYGVLSHGILPIKNDSVFISDHYPILATLKPVGKK